jgi:hypothetical protein
VKRTVKTESWDAPNSTGSGGELSLRSSSQRQEEEYEVLEADGVTRME